MGMRAWTNIDSPLNERRVLCLRSKLGQRLACERVDKTASHGYVRISQERLTCERLISGSGKTP